MAGLAMKAVLFMDCPPPTHPHPRPHIQVISIVAGLTTKTVIFADSPPLHPSKTHTHIHTYTHRGGIYRGL